MTSGVFLKRSPTIQKKGAKICSYWFLFFFNETPISSLVKNDMTLGVWIEKDRRTIGTGDAGVFLIRYPTIQKKGTKTCSYWFLFFSHEKHTICLVKNTIPQAVWIEKNQKNNLNGQCMGFLDKRCDSSEKGSQNLFILFFFFSNETHTSWLIKNTIPQAVWIEKDKITIGTGDAGVFLISCQTIQKKGAKTCSYWFFLLLMKQLLQVFQLVYLHCVIFYNETTNVWLTIKLNHVVHEGGGIFLHLKEKCFIIIIHIGSFIKKITQFK